jgi:hypothetical protein
MGKLAILAAVLTMGTLAIGAATADAATIGWFGSPYGSCFRTGSISVPAGETIQLRVGWFTEKKAQLQTFFKWQTISYSVNGGAVTTTAVGDMSGWSTPTATVNGAGVSGWLSQYMTPVLYTMGPAATDTTPADQATVTFSLTTTKPTQDTNSGNVIPAGTIFSGSCTIYAV